ncbi:MAG: type II secretion system inner membrane protein GspF [Gammaproteobacteria bacterium]|nr:type II secretion system inner membrane protein GspF [Gammaproteobacteria bacterium]
MGAFEYTALDSVGRNKKGVLEADTSRQIRQKLRDQGLAPLTVVEVKQRESKSESQISFLRRGISVVDLALITRQLATLVKAALPIEEALRTVSQQTSKPYIESMLLAVRARIKEGHTLADALADFPHVFPELYRMTVAAGEHSGFLDVVLERLADYSENRQALRQKTQLALIYPVLLTVVAVLVVIALLTFVVPQVIQVFDSIEQELPLITQILIAVSDFLRDNALLLIGGTLGITIFVATLLKRPGPKKMSHKFLLTLPIIGDLVRGSNTARFTRTFSILAGSGVPALDAMNISAKVLTNIPMRESVEEAALRVREGAGIYKSLDHAKCFPPMTLHLIASGESSGNLDVMLERASAAQEREVETMVAAFVALFEPLLIVVMGAVVLGIVLAILLPIFNLNQLVQ